MGSQLTTQRTDQGTLVNVPQSLAEGFGGAATVRLCNSVGGPA